MAGAVVRFAGHTMWERIQKEEEEESRGGKKQESGISERSFRNGLFGDRGRRRSTNDVGNLQPHWEGLDVFWTVEQKVGRLRSHSCRLSLIRLLVLVVDADSARR
jgi:hypothetical protein